MAWDDAESRRFVGGLANSYAAGFDPTSYNRMMVAEQEMALRRAADARAQAVHDMNMRVAGKLSTEQEGLLGAIPANGLPTQGGPAIPPNLQLPPVDDGVQAPSAGLPAPGANPREVAARAARIAALQGNHQAVAAYAKDVESRATKEKVRAEYARMTSLSDKDLLSDEGFRNIYNNDGKQPGAIGLSRDAKGFVIVDYDGAGAPPLPRTRAQINAAILAHLKTQYESVDEGVKLGMDLDTDAYNRNRQYGADRMGAQKTAHGMNMDEARLLEEQRRTGISAMGLKDARERANKPVWQQFIGEDQQPTLVDMNRVNVGPGGQAQLPPGVRLPSQKPAIDQAALLRYRGDLIRQFPEDPLRVEQEMARVMGGPDPIQSMVKNLAAQDAANKAAAEKQRQQAAAPQEIRGLTDRLGQAADAQEAARLGMSLPAYQHWQATQNYQSRNAPR